MSIAHIAWRGRRRSFDKPDGNRKGIAEALRAAGRQVIDLPGGKGRPDLLVVWGAGMLLMEVKNPQGFNRYEKTQVKFHAEYRGPPGSLVTVRSPEEALRATGIPV